MNYEFKFSMKQRVKIDCTDAVGVVVGLMIENCGVEYALVRVGGADTVKENWFKAAELTPAE